ncbi:MAG: metallophosphoesterase family protein [Sphingomonadaceae bacterium]
MLKRLFRSAAPVEPRAWAAPEGQRLYAIGDIHGRSDLLDDLLDQIGADDTARSMAHTQLIFLGDLIDRGSDSRGVIERLMALKAATPNARFLKGNHEELFIRIWDGDTKAASMFHRVGGRDTMLSYGVSEAEYDDADFNTLTALVSGRVPPEHIDFLRGFDDWIVAGDYLFVHAGIRPGIAIEDQRAGDLRWIRGEFTEFDGDHGMMVVHGHSITELIDVRTNRIGIDTGAFMSDALTAIGIENTDRWFLSTSEAVVSAVSA